MRIPAQATLGNFRRRPLAALGFLIVFVVAADKAANYEIAGNMTGLALVAMASVGCALVVAMLNNWRNGLSFFLTWLLFANFPTINPAHTTPSYSPTTIFTAPAHS